MKATLRASLSPRAACILPGGAPPLAQQAMQVSGPLVACSSVHQFSKSNLCVSVSRASQGAGFRGSQRPRVDCSSRPRMPCIAHLLGREDADCAAAPRQVTSGALCLTRTGKLFSRHHSTLQPALDSADAYRPEVPHRRGQPQQILKQNQMRI